MRKKEIDVEVTVYSREALMDGIQRISLSRHRSGMDLRSCSGMRAELNMSLTARVPFMPNGRSRSACLHERTLRVPACRIEASK